MAMPRGCGILERMKIDLGEIEQRRIDDDATRAARHH